MELLLVKDLNSDEFLKPYEYIIHDGEEILASVKGVFTTKPIDIKDSSTTNIGDVCYFNKNSNFVIHEINWED